MTFESGTHILTWLAVIFVVLSAVAVAVGWFGRLPPIKTYEDPK